LDFRTADADSSGEIGAAVYHTEFEDARMPRCCLPTPTGLPTSEETLPWPFEPIGPAPLFASAADEDPAEEEEDDDLDDEDDDLDEDLDDEFDDDDLDDDLDDDEFDDDEFDDDFDDDFDDEDDEDEEEEEGDGAAE